MSDESEIPDRSAWGFESIPKDLGPDENGYLVTVPSGASQFTCETHDYDTGVICSPEARDLARIHLRDQHPGECNPFECEDWRP